MTQEVKVQGSIQVSIEMAVIYLCFTFTISSNATKGKFFTSQKKCYKINLGVMLHDGVIVTQVITALKTEKWAGNEGVLQAGNQMVKSKCFVYIL